LLQRDQSARAQVESPAATLDRADDEVFA
jgi:hypothetical protein